MESLLTIPEAAAVLRMKRSTFYSKLPTLRAKGLRVVTTPRTLILASSLERLIEKAAEKETPLC